jgi:ABC-type polysaccharide/polyol phosphate transport system ATPase subunit
MMPSIVCNNVSKTYTVKREKIPVLSSINFAVNPGEVVGFIGKNGIGKSTLLKLICDIHPVTEGKITVNGTIRPLIELGDCFQDELTGLENLYLYGSFLNISEKILDERLDEIIENANLPSDFIHKKLSTYSTGMRARLAFSVALIADMDILIIDEILSVGDTEFAYKSFNKMRELKKQGKTILVVSHSLQDLQQICTRIIYLKDKNIAYDGDPSEAIMNYLQDIISESEERYLPKIQSNMDMIHNIKVSQSSDKSNSGEKTNKELLRYENEAYSMIQELAAIYSNICQQLDHKKIMTQDEDELRMIRQKIALLSSKLLTIKQHLFYLSISEKEFLDTFLELKNYYYAQIRNTDETKKKLNILQEFKSFLENETLSQNKDIQEELQGVRCQIEYLLKSEKEMVKKENFGILSRFGNNVGEIYCKNLISSIQEESLRLLSLKLDSKQYEEIKAKRAELIKEFRSFLIDNVDIIHEPEFMITHCFLTDGKKEEKYVFSEEEKINIHISAKTKQELKDIVVGVGLYTQDGYHISGPNSHFHGHVIEKIDNELHTTFSIEPSQLLNGTFMITISLHSTEDYTPYDIHDNFYFFKVQPKKTKDFGILKLDSHWDFSFN